MFWDTLTNIGVSKDSLHLKKLSQRKNVMEKKSVKSPIHVGINTNASCANVSSRQSIRRLFSKLPFWKSFLALCKANEAKATIVSVCFHWCGLHEWWWIGMWWLKVAYESKVSWSFQFVELIITSGIITFVKECHASWDQLCCYF